MALVLAENKRGRPKVELDSTAILELSRLGFGHKSIAKIMTELDQYVSPSTVRRALKNRIQ
jgi:hypothetical protein